MSVFGDIFNAFTWWRTRRTTVTVEITQVLVDSDAPRVISLLDAARPVPKVYRLEIVTTNRGEQTEYMRGLTIDVGAVSYPIGPESSSPIQPREPLVTSVRIDRLAADLTGAEFYATAHMTSGDVYSTPTRLDDALLAELDEHNRRAG